VQCGGSDGVATAAPAIAASPPPTPTAPPNKGRGSADAAVCRRVGTSPDRSEPVSTLAAAAALARAAAPVRRATAKRVERDASGGRTNALHLLVHAAARRSLLRGGASGDSALGTRVDSQPSGNPTPDVQKRAVLILSLSAAWRRERGLGARHSG